MRPLTVIVTASVAPGSAALLRGLRMNGERSVRLVGTDEDQIVAAVSLLLTDIAAYSAMATAVNPYGDGQAARRAVAALAHYFGLGPPADEFNGAKHR